MSHSETVSSDTVTIFAPAQLVWDIIIDFESYSSWNKFCPSAKGDLSLGSPLTMQVNLGNGLQEQIEYFTVIEPPHRIVWSMENRPGDPIHADRSQIVTPIDDRSCTYVTFDEFSGDMVPDMMDAMGEPVREGFNLCAQCLKDYAETRYREQREGT
ncbi:MAG: SRPBCC domain-containing protein [Pseudomonadota bacterium]